MPSGGTSVGDTSASRISSGGMETTSKHGEIQATTRLFSREREVFTPLINTSADGLARLSP